MHAGFFAIDVRAQCPSQNIANEGIHYSLYYGTGVFL